MLKNFKHRMNEIRIEINQIEILTGLERVYFENTHYINIKKENPVQ